MIPRRRIPLAWRALLAGLAGSGHFDRERRITEFEKSAADYLGVACVRATASGRDALGLILDGLGLKAGDALIVPAYTLGELLPLIEARGLRPRAADVDPFSFNVTPATVERALTPDCRAIFVAHLFGAPCDIIGLQLVAEARGLPLIEDCAHALGASVGGRKLGSFGRAALFSLEVNKQLSTYGGGLLASNDPALASFVGERLAARAQREWPPLRKALIKHVEEMLVRSPLYGPVARRLFGENTAQGFEGFYRRANASVRGAPSGFSGFQARLGLCRLAGVDARNQRLNALRAEVVAALPPAFRAQQRGDHGDPAFYNLAVRSEIEPRRLRRHALALGLDIAIGSEVMDDVAAQLGQDDCPVAARLFADTLLLPLYDGIEHRTVERMLERLAAAAERAATEQP